MSRFYRPAEQVRAEQYDGVTLPTWFADRLRDNDPSAATAVNTAKQGDWLVLRADNSIGVYDEASFGRLFVPGSLTGADIDEKIRSTMDECGCGDSTKAYKAIVALIASIRVRPAPAVGRCCDGECTGQCDGDRALMDDAAVDRFAKAMKAKLAVARAKGRGGWDDKEDLEVHLSNLLRGHVEKGDPVDVANFCMFLHQRGESIQPAPPRGAFGCHCATCTCNPGMTPAIRFDASEAEREGAVRSKLIEMGWTPPPKDGA